jgi:hypothetical protein
MLGMLAPEERLRELLLQLPEITSQLDGTYISQLIASGRISASSRISSGVTIWKITSLSPH